MDGWNVSDCLFTASCVLTSTVYDRGAALRVGEGRGLVFFLYIFYSHGPNERVSWGGNECRGCLTVVIRAKDSLTLKHTLGVSATRPSI